MQSKDSFDPARERMHLFKLRKKAQDIKANANKLIEYANKIEQYVDHEFKRKFR